MGWEDVQPGRRGAERSREDLGVSVVDQLVYDLVEDGAVGHGGNGGEGLPHELCELARNVEQGLEGESCVRVLGGGDDEVHVLAAGVEVGGVPDAEDGGAYGAEEEDVGEELGGEELRGGVADAAVDEDVPVSAN